MRHALAAMVFALGLSSAYAAAPDNDALLKARDQAIAENALIAKANAALAAKNWAEAETMLKQLVTDEPTRWEFEQRLGTAQLNLGHYEDAVASLGKAFALAQDAAGAKTPDAKAKDALGPILTAQGNAYLKLKKNAEAKAAYQRAASLDPHPAVAWFNLCAVLYNMGEMTEVVPACDKAIAADPKKADAYFIKGSVLYADATLGPGNKIVVSDAALKALRKYLALAPNGGHAADVKEMLEMAGQTVATTGKPKPAK